MIVRRRAGQTLNAVLQSMFGRAFLDALLTVFDRYVVIDIADPAKKGSRGTKDAIHINVVDLLPKEGGE